MDKQQMINFIKLNMKDITRIELTEVCPTADVVTGRVEQTCSANSEVVRFMYMHHSSYSCSLLFKV
jgi:hypothetical protein